MSIVDVIVQPSGSPSHELTAARCTSEGLAELLLRATSDVIYYKVYLFSTIEKSKNM